VTPQDFHGYRRPGVSETQFSMTDSLVAPGMPTTWGSANNLGAVYGANRSTQTNYRASASYVTGSHNVKTGFTLLHSWRYATQEPNNSVTLTLRAGQPFSLTQWATPIQFHETVDYNMGLFAQDQWRIKRMTVNYGVRADFLKASVDPQDVPAGPFTPARQFEALENVPNWKDISPRVGVAYDLFNDGKTALKAHIGRYVVGESYTLARAVNPMQSTINSVTRTWAPAAGQVYTGTYNPNDDCDLTNPNPNSKPGGRAVCGAIQNPAFGSTVARTTNYDPSVTTGWHVRPNNWEFQASIQREIVPRVSVYAGYTRRWYDNLFATQNLNVTNADYTQYCVNVPVDPRLPGGGGNQVCGLYDPNRPIAPNNLIYNASRVGGIEDVYDGFDFDANARLARNIIVSGGVNFGRERVNTCSLITDVSLTQNGGARPNDPRNSEFCDVTPPLNPIVKGQVAYPLPWDISISATFQSLPGPELRAQYPLSNALVPTVTTLGRNFTGVAPTVDVVPAGTMYGDRVYQTDLRLSRNFRAGRTVIRPTFSVYNLFNANPIQAYQNAFPGPAANPTTGWLAPTVILQSRFADVGVQIDF